MGMSQGTDKERLTCKTASCGALQSLEAAEAALLPLRQALHRRLGLPLDRPLLRCANALSFPEAAQQPAAAGAGTSAKGRYSAYLYIHHHRLLVFAWQLRAQWLAGCRLRDVHVGLPPSGVPGGRQHLIQGSYDYYHYMQVRAFGHTPAMHPCKGHAPLKSHC
jgi:hypothetical protein